VIIKKLNDVPAMELPGYDNVKKQIVIGPDDGSEEIVLRHFTLQPGGSSPHHTHDFPHLVRIEAGTGILIDETGTKHPMQAGHYAFIESNEVHQFRNTGSDQFKFICIVPRRGES